MVTTSTQYNKGKEGMLRKTKMCKFFQTGGCDKGDNCSFAHDFSDLQSQPNLRKTQLCLAFGRNGTCRDGAACKYAHGQSELQVDTRQSSTVPSPTNAYFGMVPVTIGTPMHRIDLNSNTPSILMQPVQPGVFKCQVQPIQFTSARCGMFMKKVQENDVASIQTTEEDLGFELESLTTAERQASQWSALSEDSPQRQASQWSVLSEDDPPADYSSEASTSIPSSSVQYVSERSDLLSPSRKSSASVPLSISEEMVVDTKRGKSLKKTKMCNFFKRGMCTKGSECSFAHDSKALKSRPNLFRTSLCIAFERSGYCNMGDDCKYAHGREQLLEVPSQNERDMQEYDMQEPDVQSPKPSAGTFDSDDSGVVVGVKNTFIDFSMPKHTARRRSALL